MSASRLLPAALILGAPLGAHAAAAPAPGSAAVKRGVDLWQSGAYDGAIAAWRVPANAGDADAQFNLAQAYKLGRGVPVDMRQAEGWYRKAALQGHEQAQATLGLIMFQNGDRAGAMPWLQKAADRGEPRAQYVYGTALFNGDVVAKDWPHAYALMTRAAAAGLPQAKTSLAQMDQFVPMEQRKQGTALAANLAQPTPAAVPTAMPASPRPAALPASRPAQTAAVSAPAPKPVAASKPVAAPKPVAMPKPAAVAVTAKPAPLAAKAVPAPVRTVAAPAATGGGWRVQLGAYASASGAESQWKTVSGKAAALRALRPFYVKAGAVTRLQAGPLPSKDAAASACRAAAAAGAPCFPVAG